MVKAQFSIENPVKILEKSKLNAAFFAGNTMMHRYGELICQRLHNV